MKLSYFLFFAFIFQTDLILAQVSDSTTLKFIEKEYEAIQSDKEGLLIHIENIAKVITNSFEQQSKGRDSIWYKRRQIKIELYAKLFQTMLDNGFDETYDPNTPGKEPIYYDHIVVSTDPEVLANEELKRKKYMNNVINYSFHQTFLNLSKHFKSYFKLYFKKHGDDLDDLEQIIAKQVGNKPQTDKLMELFKLAIQNN